MVMLDINSNTLEKIPKKIKNQVNLKKYCLTTNIQVRLKKSDNF